MAHLCPLRWALCVAGFPGTQVQHGGGRGLACGSMGWQQMELVNWGLLLLQDFCFAVGEYFVVKNLVKQNLPLYNHFRVYSSVALSTLLCN